MAELILPRRFKGQPQHLASIDRQGLGKGIQLLFNPAVGPVDLATGRIWTAGGNASVTTGQKGKAFSFDGTDDYYGYTGYPEITGNVGTFFLWCPIVGPADPNGHLFFGHSSPTVVWYQVSNIGSLYLLGIEGGGIISWYNTTSRSLIFSSGGTAATAKAYLDGRDSGVVWGAAPTSWGAGNKNFNLGRYVGGSSWDFNGSILIAGYTTAIWGAAEAKAFHENPWQIFKAPARRLFSVSAGGTTHDLVGASAAQANSASAPSVTQTHELLITPASQANAASDVAITVGASIDLTISASIQANTASAGAVGQTHVLVISASVQSNSVSAVSVTQVHPLTVADLSQVNLAGTGAITLLGDLVISSPVQANSASTGQITTPQTLTIANAIQANRVSSGAVSDGVVVESALTTGISQTIRIKKPGIPVNTPEWLRTLLEILIGRRGNKINPIAFQELTFSATPTQAECEALYQYMNEVRTAVNEILTRLDS